MAEWADLQPTQRRMLEVLSDGLPHHRKELHACLRDEMQPLNRVSSHLFRIRRYLRRLGQDVVCEFRSGKGRGIWYRHVRNLHPYDE